MKYQSFAAKLRQVPFPWSIIASGLRTAMTVHWSCLSEDSTTILTFFVSYQSFFVSLVYRKSRETLVCMLYGNHACLLTMTNPLHTRSFNSYTTDQDLKKFAHTPIPDDPKHSPDIPFVEGTISYAGESRRVGFTWNHDDSETASEMKHVEHNL